MIRTPRPIFSQPFLISICIIWLAITVTAIFYRDRHPADTWLLTAALPACLLESAFYVAATFEDTRRWFSRTLDRVQQAMLLYASALLPYLVFSLIAGQFDSRRFLLLAILTALFANWYTLVPRRLPYDIGFVAIAAAPIISHVFRRIYTAPNPEIAVDILGHLMWIRLGVLALLTIRPWNPGRFQLWPAKADWRSGAFWYAVTLVPICLVALATGDVRFVWPQQNLLTLIGIGVGTFFGILWVVALSEELFFRGFIERAMLNARWGPAMAVIISALLFGSVHLWYHGFPNWRRAVTAVVLGIGCGVAYQRTGSVNAPMVTHALVVTTWRLFFR
jgi:uncharacterized protein